MNVLAIRLPEFAASPAPEKPTAGFSRVLRDRLQIRAYILIAQLGAVFTGLGPFCANLTHMRVELAFGRTGLRVDLPEEFRYRVLEARSAEPLPEPATVLEKALDAPVACPPLAEMAAGKRSAAISVCDITRPTPNSFVLPPVLRRLEQAGIGRDAITIFIATGLHRPATAAEIREIVGEETAAACRVVNHDARQLSEHRSLGTTASGTPAHIDERFMAADVHITLGFIEPHLMLGYSGGRKLIVPGLAAQETIKVLHSPRFMRDPRATEGSIEDNPLHRELLEIARMARHDFMVDVALTRDRDIAGVFAGDPVEAHRKGVEFVSRVMLEQLEEPVDAVITTSAGYPLDLTYYQAIKGVTAAQHIVKPGGKILLVAACEEGTGAPEFRRMLKEFPTAKGFLDHIADAEVIVDQWQLEKLALVAEKAELLFYVPGLPADYYPTLWGTAFNSATAAAEALMSDLKPGAAVAIIPEGPYVLAKAR
jgi:nickel-dependent lactate racemase